MQRSPRDLPVTVGFDGTELGAAALDWAVDEARRRGAGLNILLASGSAVGPTPGIPMMSPWPDEAAEELIAEGRARAGHRAPELTVQAATSLGGAAGALIDLSTTSSLVVLGGRRRSVLGEFFLGATAPQVAAHAHCPVVVVPGPREAVEAAPLVLGVDGSAESQAACEFAFTRAADTGRPLIAVYAWYLDTPTPMGLTRLSTEVVDTIETGHRELAADSIQTWSAKFPDVQVETLVERAEPVRALLQAATDADLLVVGSRGHGGFTGLFLGSVSQGILHRPHTCPVVVVHRGDPV